MFLTSRYLGIVMEYVTGGDLADMVDVWNVRNRKSHRARGPGEPIPHQWVFLSLNPASSRCKRPHNESRRQGGLHAARPVRDVGFVCTRIWATGVVPQNDIPG